MNRRAFLKAAAFASSAFPFLLPQLRADEIDRLLFCSPLTHSDWMLHPGVKWGPEGVHHMLDQCKAAGWSRIFFRATDGGRALYNSKLMRPMGQWDEDNFWNPQTECGKAIFKRYYGHYSDAQRKAVLAQFDALDYSKFDPLAEAVVYGHKIGLQIHAWVTINEDDHAWGLQSEFSKRHPELRWRKRDDTPYHSQLSFAFPEVRKYKLALLKELVSHYAIDGFFLDWIRTGDVRDNPQNDAEGVANYGYEKPLVEKFKKRFGKSPMEVPNGDERWVKLRAEPQTEFMREARKLARKHHLPISVLVGHPWHYRGEQNKIDGNLRGLLLDVKTWAKEGLIDAAVAAGYYRDGGNSEKAWRALREETEGKAEVWTYAWVPKSAAEFEESFSLAKNLGAKQILFWEADYIENGSAEVKAAMQKRARF